MRAPGISGHLPGSAAGLALADFWTMDPEARDEVLLEGIAASHAYHYEHNTAYRATVAVRGVGPELEPGDMPRLLRTTAQAFKSYADILGTPFPQDRAAGFFDWLADQCSVELSAPGRSPRDRYRSLESLLRSAERSFPDKGWELLTSRGTSGRMTLVPRNRRSMGLAAESLRLAFERYAGLTAKHTALFMAPKRTRVATALLARRAMLAAGIAPDRLHHTVLLAATPDLARLRAGRPYRTGWRGALEKQISHPLLGVLQSRLVEAQVVESAVARLIPAAAHGEPVLLFGSLDRLHTLASFLLESGRMMPLVPGSVLCTVGGPGVGSARTKGSLGRPAPAADPVQARMREDLREAFRLVTEERPAIRDIYSLAEANWAAVQCSRGHYHIPPWVYAATVDDDDRCHDEGRSTGLLAFFDPFGGGDVFPAFFRTTDRVTLIRGGTCTCGETGDYLEKGSIRRTDLPAVTAREHAA